MEEREHLQGLRSWRQYWVDVPRLESLQQKSFDISFSLAIVPVQVSACGLLSSSVAFFPENTKVLMRLAATLLGLQWIFLSTISQLPYALTWIGKCVATHSGAKKTLRREPLRVSTAGSWAWCWKVISSMFACSSPRFLSLQVQLPDLVDFLPVALLTTENGRSQAFWTGYFPGAMGIRTNITLTVISIIKALSKYELILFVWIRLCIVRPTL